MVNSSLRHRHGHIGKFQINCELVVSPSGVFIFTIDNNNNNNNNTVY